MNVNVKTVSVELTEANARYTIQALSQYLDHLSHKVHNEELSEDEQFFFANDLMEAGYAYEELKSACVAAFGAQIAEVRHELI